MFDKAVGICDTYSKPVRYQVVRRDGTVRVERGTRGVQGSSESAN